jgi:hypothetical protein
MEIIVYSKSSWRSLGYLSLDGWATVVLEAPSKAKAGYDLCGQYLNYFFGTFTFGQESLHLSCKSIYQHQKSLIDLKQIH